MKNWILAIRPKTLFASLAPVLLGLAVAFTETKSINAQIAFVTALCALFLQISSNLANDYLDALKGVDNHARLGPTRVTSSGLIPASTMKNALILTLFISLLLGVILMLHGGPFIMLIGLLSLYFAYGYTGGPYPLSYMGLGEVAAFLFFGIIAVVGTHYLQTGFFSKLAVILGAGPGFISACILAINNLRDIKSDTESHKRTIAVRFGEKFQRRLCLLLILGSFVICAFIFFTTPFKWISPALVLPLFFHRTWLQIYFHPINERLNLALQRTAQYNLLYCLIISLGLVFTTTAGLTIGLK